MGTIAGVWIASIFAKRNLKISQKHEIRLSKENRKTQFELSLLEKRFDAFNECFREVSSIKNVQNETSHVEFQERMRACLSKNYSYLPPETRDAIKKVIQTSFEYVSLLEDFWANLNQDGNSPETKKLRIEVHEAFKTLHTIVQDSIKDYVDESYWNQMKREMEASKNEPE